MAADKLPVRVPGEALAAAEAREAERMIAERDAEIAAQLEAQRRAARRAGGVY